MATYSVDINGNITNNKKKKKKTATYSVGLDGKVIKNTQDEEEQKEQEQEQERTWFKKSEGNWIQTILGSAGDVVENAGVGLVGILEKSVDGMASIGASQYALQSGLSNEKSQKTYDMLKKSTTDFIMQDIVDEEKVIDDTLGKLNENLGIDTDANSVFGAKSDSLAQSGGQLLGQIALNPIVPWYMTTGFTSLGSEVESSLGQGASYEQALGSGLITAGADILTEKLFGGSGLGEKGLINLEPLTKGITNKVVKSLADFGVDIFAEGSEEVIAGVMSNLGSSLYKEENAWELLTNEEAIDGYIESFIGGAVLGGGANAVNVGKSIKNKTDYRTGVTENEQKVLDKVVESRVKEAEEGGKKLTKKEKTEIEQDVLNSLQRGEIDLDTIESTFGGERYSQYDALKKEADEYNTLYETESGKLSEKQKDRLAELKAKNTENSYENRLFEAKSQLTQEVQKATEKDGFLQESYGEYAKRGETFKLSEKEKKQFTAEEMKIVNKAIESGDINNTRKAHDMVSFVAKLSAQTKTDFDFTNNKKLAEAGYIVEGKTIDGFKEGNKIAVNLQSKKALNTVVGHEITHVLEGTDLYTALQSTLKEYATTKGVYDSLFNKAKENYKNVYKGLTEAEYNKKIEQEVTADLVGDYIFSDMDFVRNLSTKNPNVFQKVFNEIKYMLKVATAGSDAEKQLLKAKKIFEDVYRDTKRNTTSDSEVQMSTSTKEVSVNERQYILKDSNAVSYAELSKLKNVEGVRIEEKYDANNDYEVNEVIDSTIKSIENNDGENAVVKMKNYPYSIKVTKAGLRHGLIGKRLSGKNQRLEGKQFKHTETNYNNANISEVYGKILENSVVVNELVDRDGGLVLVGYAVSGDNQYFVRTIARKSGDTYVVEDWDSTLYLKAVNTKKVESQPTNNSRTEKGNNSHSKPSTTISIDDFLKNVKGISKEFSDVLSDDVLKHFGDKKSDKPEMKVRFSLSDNSITDNKGNSVSIAVQKRLANTKAVDENGDLKVLYHGTPNGEFTIFDKSKGSVEGDFGSGFYFTDNEADVERNYEGGGPDFENKVSRRAEQIEYEEEIDYDEAVERAREELYVGSNKFEVYLNIENPAIVGETMLLEQDAYLEQYDESDFEDYDEYIAEVEQLVTDDIESILWDIEQNIDLYGDTSGIANVLYEAYYEGGIDIADLKERINDLYLNDSEGNMVGNEVTRQIIESLGYDGIIDSTVSSKFSNMGMSEDTTHYIVFKPNQIKSITNQNPTDNPDINLSLTDNNQDIAPIPNGIYGKDVMLDRPIAPEPQGKGMETQDIAPPINQSVEVNKMIDGNMYAPVTEEEANAMLDSDENWERMRSLQEAEEPQDIESPEYDNEVQVNDPFDERDIKEVGKRNVNAYMYDNPEVKPFYQDEARIMLGELQNSVKGERFYNDQLYYDTNGEQGFSGTSRMTSDEIAELLDNYKYSYAEIEKGLKAIIEDHGAENIAVAKRIEFFLNERLLNGHTDFQTGIDIPRNQDYVNLLESMQVNESHNVDVDLAPSINFGNLETTDRPIAPVREVHASEPLPLPTGNEVRGVRMNAEQKQGTPRTTERGNLRSWAETSTESEVVNREILPKDLDQSKIYYEPISNKKTLDTANANLDRMGYDKALEVFNAKLENRTVSLSDIALGERLVQESLKRGDTKTTGELIQNIAILGTELGQKVQALSIIQRMTPEGQLKMLQKVVNRGKAKGDRVFDNVEITQEMIDKILAVYGKDGTYDQNKLNEAVEQVKQDIADQMSVTKMDKVNAWRYLAMLGNPKTHIRNIVSNITMQATTEIKDLVARTTETLAPIKNRTKTFKQATDVVKRFAEQSTAEAKAMLTSENSYSESADIKSKRDVFKTKILQKAYDFNNDLMTKEDWWFKKARYKKSLQEFLTANGIKTQEDINNNPELVEKGKKYATEQAQIATFQQTSWLANKINEIERKNVATQVGVGAILPFKKTPINIAKTGLAYSPLGFAKSLTYDLHQMKKGNIEASQVIDNLAKGVTGSALVYIGYMLAMSGLLNGGGEDDKEGKYDYQLGEQSYSLNFGGSTYSLNWLTPVAMPLFIGANAFEMLEEDKELSFDTTSEALAQTLDPLSEMSFLSSLDSVLTSYESGMGKFAGIGEAMLQNYVTQFAPTLMSQVAQVTDDTKRSTTVAGDSDARMIEQTINKLKYKIPGLRQTLEPTIDIWGNEVKQTENVMARAFETFIAPYSRKDNIANEIDAEIKEVYSQTGDNGVIPTVPNKNVQFKGEKYKMSADEYTDYKKVYGQLANDTLEDLFKTSTYQNSDAEYKAELVNRVYKYASDEAKKDYLAKEGVEYTNTTEDNVPVYKTDKIKGAIDNDMTLEEFDLYNRSAGKYYISKVIGGYDTYKAITSSLGDIEADKDIYGRTINNSRKTKVVSYLNNLDADYYTKIMLYKAEYTSDDRYNVEIINYLNEREDISYQEMADILTELGFKVTADGRIIW